MDFIRSRKVLVYGVLLSSLSSCAPLVIGGGAFVGALTTREKGLSGTLQDSKIANTLRAKFYHFNPGLQAAISVSVQRGQVLLTGVVKEPKWVVEAEKMAWEIKEVKEVENRIEVSDPEGLKVIMRDSFLTSRIKTSLLLSKNVRSLNYSIKTVCGVVYVMGTARDEEELKAVIDIARNTPGIEKVICYARLKEDPLP